MSTLPISRPFEGSRGSHMVPSDAATSDLIGNYRRKGDLKDVYIYGASDISRIVPYSFEEEYENTSSQESFSLGSRYWAQDSKLTNDYESFVALVRENMGHAVASPKALTPWNLVALPASFKDTIAGIPDIRLLDAMYGWETIKSEATEKESSISANATTYWNPETFSGFLKTAIASMSDTQLLDALHDWKKVKHEAVEEGFPIPTDMALENSRRVLIGMYSISPRRFEVYPTPDGEVAIDTSGGFRRSILLLCDSDGGALCLVNINGEFRRAHYSDIDKLPDGFIREALIELEQTDDTIK